VAGDVTGAIRGAIDEAVVLVLGEPANSVALGAVEPVRVGTLVVGAVGNDARHVTVGGDCGESGDGCESGGGGAESVHLEYACEDLGRVDWVRFDDACAVWSSVENEWMSRSTVSVTND